jgi:hypothetical protein
MTGILEGPFVVGEHETRGPAHELVSVALPVGWPAETGAQSVPHVLVAGRVDPRNTPVCYHDTFTVRLYRAFVDRGVFGTHQGHDQAIEQTRRILTLFSCCLRFPRSSIEGLAEAFGVAVRCVPLFRTVAEDFGRAAG